MVDHQAERFLKFHTKLPRPVSRSPILEQKTYNPIKILSSKPQEVIFCRPNFDWYLHTMIISIAPLTDEQKNSMKYFFLFRFFRFFFIGGVSAQFWRTNWSQYAKILFRLMAHPILLSACTQQKIGVLNLRAVLIIIPPSLKPKEPLWVKLVG